MEQSEERKKSREKWIDIAKGICILSVIAGHTGHYWIGMIVYAYHLPVFYMLAGYTLKREKQYDIFWIRKKANRLLFPYIVSCFVISIYDVIVAFYHHVSPHEWMRIIVREVLRIVSASGSTNELFGYDIGWNIGALWFLPAMFFMLLLMVFLILRINSYSGRIVISVVCYIIAIYLGTKFWLPFSILPAMATIMWAVIGQMFGDIKLIQKMSWKWCIPMMMIYVWGIKTEMSQYYINACAVKNIVLTPIVCLCASICILKLSFFIKENCVLEWLGRNSLYIICIHGIVLCTINKKIKEWIGTQSYADSYVLRYFLCHIIICCLGCALIVILKRKRKGNE